MNWRALLGGMIGLALLEAAVSSQAAANRAGGLLTGVSTVIDHVLSPTVAAIPDLRKHGGAVATTAAPGGSTTLPADWTTAPAAPTPPTTIQI
jgi:hypothetical protein